MRVLVTGATGFIGSAFLAHSTSRDGWRLRAASRAIVPRSLPGVESVGVGEIGPETDWTAAMSGVDAVVHTAGSAHMRDGIDAMRRVNIDGAIRLANQAAAAGVKRFVFLSSIKVNGEQTALGRPYTGES